MAFWEIANALFSGIIQFFTNISVPGLGVSVFFVLVALILINVVINVVLIILGVSSAYNDPVSAVSYDMIQEERPEFAPRSSRVDYDAVRARYRAQKFLKSRSNRK